MVHLLLFPNQLFEVGIIKKFVTKPTRVTFVEDEAFYGRKRMKVNKIRLAYMEVLHKSYVELLRKHFTNVEIGTRSFNYKGVTDGVYIDPCDTTLEKKLGHLQRLDSPSFVLSRDDLDEYNKMKNGKRLQHSHFYNFVKAKLQILQNVKNMDKNNRKPFSKNIPMPPDQYRITYSSPDVFSDEYLRRLPITHADAENWLYRFFNERFENYGAYQDVMIDTNPLLYHSGLSIYLNNGLITPAQILKVATKYKSHINSYEGFVRQIIGWREYSRYYYHFVKPEVYNQNPFKQHITKLPKNWGDEIPIVKKAKEHAAMYGYLNHIQRLMVVSNYMTLSGYHPDVIYKWMFEFALDSYEWVMIFNCYSMASYSDNGFAMRKPYICSSKYLLRMSNEPKGDWEAKWDALYYAFIKKQKSILAHTQLANLVS